MLQGCPKDLKYTSIIQVTACFIRTLPRCGSHGVIPKRVGHLVKYWSTQRSKLTLNCISSCGRVVRSWFFWIWRISGKKKRSVQDWLSWARESRRSIEVKNSFIIWTRRGTSSQVPQLPWISSIKWDGETENGKMKYHRQDSQEEQGRTPRSPFAANQKYFQQIVGKVKCSDSIYQFWKDTWWESFWSGKCQVKISYDEERLC